MSYTSQNQETCDKKNRHFKQKYSRHYYYYFSNFWNFCVSFVKLYSENLKATNTAMNLNNYSWDLNRNAKYSDTHNKIVVIQTYYRPSTFQKGIGNF